MEAVIRSEPKPDSGEGTGIKRRTPRATRAGGARGSGPRGPRARVFGPLLNSLLSLD